VGTLYPVIIEPNSKINQKKHKMLEQYKTFNWYLIFGIHKKLVKIIQAMKQFHMLLWQMITCSMNINSYFT